MLTEETNNKSLDTGRSFFIAMYLKQVQEPKVPALEIMNFLFSLNAERKRNRDVTVGRRNSDVSLHLLM